MNIYDVPLVIRGEVIRGDWVSFGSRSGQIEFRTPDVKCHIQRLVMRNPVDMQDLYQLRMDDVLDYLDALGKRLSPKDNPHIRQALEMNLGAGALS